MTINDLFEAIPEDKINNNIYLIYESNSKTNVAVNTPFGLSKRVELEKLVQQGGIFGGILCSNSVDKFGKQCLEQNKHLYIYKQKTKVPPLVILMICLG